MMPHTAIAQLCMLRSGPPKIRREPCAKPDQLSIEGSNRRSNLP